MNDRPLPQSLSKWLLPAPLLILAWACSQSVAVGTDHASQSSDTRSVELKHEKCDVESKDAVRVDVNNDGKSEVTRVMKGGREVCRAVDLNFDGRIDSYLYFDDQNQLRRRESDFDRDGITDEIATFKNGKVVMKERETNLDAKIDTWDFYQNDILVRRERDSNADGRVDQWWSFPDPNKLECPVVEADGDGDGRPDTRQDICKEREAQLAAASAAAAPPPTPPPTAPPAAIATSSASSSPKPSAPPVDAGASDAKGAQ